MIITHVKKARKDYNKNGVVIKKGESYWWMRTQFKEKMYFKKEPSAFEISKYLDPSITRYGQRKKKMIDEITAALWKRNISEVKIIHRGVDVNRKRNKERNPYADIFLSITVNDKHLIFFQRLGEKSVRMRERKYIGTGTAYTIQKSYVRGSYIPFLWDLLNHMKNR